MYVNWRVEEGDSRRPRMRMMECDVIRRACEEHGNSSLMLSIYYCQEIVLAESVEEVDVVGIWPILFDIL